MAPRVKNMTQIFLKIDPTPTSDPAELRRRALNLYKVWYRKIPVMFFDYHIFKTPEEGRSKLREIFVRNSQISDPREVNALITKGMMELNEMSNHQKEVDHIYKYFNRYSNPKTKSFLTKFLDGR